MTEELTEEQPQEQPFRTTKVSAGGFSTYLEERQIDWPALIAMLRTSDAGMIVVAGMPVTLPGAEGEPGETIGTVHHVSTQITQHVTLDLDPGHPAARRILRYLALGWGQHRVAASASWITEPDGTTTTWVTLNEPPPGALASDQEDPI